MGEGLAKWKEQGRGGGVLELMCGGQGTDCELIIVFDTVLFFMQCLYTYLKNIFILYTVSSYAGHYHGDNVGMLCYVVARRQEC